jgi:F420H(2)-dependent quinone reductase
MAYLRPSLLVKRVFNPVARRLGIGGASELVVRRRRSGKQQRIPVIPVVHDSARYIVSTRGESDWVRNVRAAGSVELGGQLYRATEIPAVDRPPVIAAYRAMAGRTVETYFRQLPDPADHPVFRLDA